MASTYLPSDLQRRYRLILDEAKAGQARLRDLDGTNILVLPEREVEVLRRIGAAAANLAALERLAEISSARQAEVAEYGEWSWLRVFDEEDLREFVRDVREAIVVGVREGSSELLDEQLRAWRVTAEQAEDPLFATILKGGFSEDDYVEVHHPCIAEGARADGPTCAPTGSSSPTPSPPCERSLRKTVKHW